MQKYKINKPPTMKTSKNKLTQIIHGNTEEVLDNQIADASVDLIFAVTPYNLGKPVYRMVWVIVS